MIEHYKHNNHLSRAKMGNFSFNKYDCISDMKNFIYTVALQYDSFYAIPHVLNLIKEYNFPKKYDLGFYNVKLINFLLRNIILKNRFMMVH